MTQDHHAHADGEMVDAAKHFNDSARTWDTPEKLQRTANIAKGIVSQIPLDASWTGVEIGCGTGALSLQLGGRIKHLILTDVSDGMLEVAREKTAGRPDKYEVCQHDFVATPLAEPFDVAYSAMALHHIADHEALITNIVAGLRSNGWVAFADLAPDPDNSYHAHGVQVEHHGIDPEKLEALLAAHGLVDLSHVVVDTLTKEHDDAPATSHDIILTTGRLA